MHDVYHAVWLNGSERGWGVAYRATGALVVVDGRLAVRLTREDAEALAASLPPEKVTLPEGFPRRALPPRR